MDKKQNILNKRSFEQAGKDLLRKVHDAESDNLQEALASWQEIEARTTQPRTSFRLRSRYILSVAASIAVLLSVGLYFWMDTKSDTSMSLALLENNTSSLSGDEIVLIESDDKMQLKDESSIKYDVDGKSNAEQHVVKKEITEEKKEKKEEINQIIVPKGRRADITFSDGTKMYVNASSRVIYPALFKNDRREIVVEGEVYLDVKKDPSRPFIVKTKDFEVKVLGTQFNICAYKEDAATSVVLVEGKVEVETTNKKKVVLFPNQLMSVDDKGPNIKEVDVFEYICWKDNIMLLNARTAGNVFDRLSRHYGRRIVCDSQLGNIPVSGKLDLREKLEDVVNILCQSLYLTYSVNENKDIIISKK